MAPAIPPSTGPIKDWVGADVEPVVGEVPESEVGGAVVGGAVVGGAVVGGAVVGGAVVGGAVVGVAVGVAVEGGPVVGGAVEGGTLKLGVRVGLLSTGPMGALPLPLPPIEVTLVVLDVWPRQERKENTRQTVFERIG